MLRTKLLGWLVCVAVIVTAGLAYAQRDAGAKARGEFGTGFWSSQYNRSAGASRAQSARPAERIVYSRPQAVQEREYRVSSYEPSPVAAGETVRVASDQARLMRGSELVGTLEKGRQFKVLRVVNGWLGVVVDDGGEAKRGWVWHQDVSPIADETARPSN